MSESLQMVESAPMKKVILTYLRQAALEAALRLITQVEGEGEKEKVWIAHEWIIPPGVPATRKDSYAAIPQQASKNATEE